MGLSAFNRARAMQKAKEEALRAEKANSEKLSSQPVVESVPEPIMVKEQIPAVAEKPKRKRTDAEKLKGKKE